MTVDDIVWRAERDIASYFVFAREINGKQSLGKRRKVVHEIAARSFPLLNPRKAIEFSDISRCDKIFATCWLDASTVALGTKDNKFILWNVFSNTFTTIPIPEIGSVVPQDSCGIHDIDVNLSQSLIATGGNSPLDIAIFSRDSMMPTCILKGHDDWVFGSKFVDDNILVSASRDSTVSMWRVPHETPRESEPLPLLEPVITRKEHATKVRAVGYHRPKNQIATVAADSVVKIWDRANMDVVASMEFPQCLEMTCMAVDQTYDFMAVGYQTGVCVLDMRGPTVAMRIDDYAGNTQWGIRSIDIFHHFISIGGGYGHMSFFDLRNKSYIETREGKYTLKTGKGWVDAANHFPEFEGHHAIYSNKFDPSGGRLLVAGGPIMHNAKGSYAAVW
eukprot:Phypoly_transcript_09676.p1 GENE.Phypoly_transcript_09676~~Phypoly_transcript_09676.p1  ORF type:complete len:390 (+),score=37.57 Phypoly_transcript_09676:137-1306(+)